MSEREKGPGPTLPKKLIQDPVPPPVPEMPRELFVYAEPDHECWTGLTAFEHREVAEMTRRDDIAECVPVGEIERYVRADLAPDPERERLVETIRALVTTEDDGPEGAMGARWILGQVRAALEAHDAKGEAGDDAATRPPSPHSP